LNRVKISLFRNVALHKNSCIPKKKGNKDRIKEIKKEVKREGHKTIGGIPKREKKMKG